MVWIIVLLCIILTVFLILTLRLGLRIRYSEEKGLTVVLTAAGVPLRLIYPETRKTVKIRLRDFTPRAVKKRREKSNKEKFKSRKISRKQNGMKKENKRSQISWKCCVRLYGSSGSCLDGFSHICVRI